MQSRLQGQHDIPINAKGRSQARHAGGVLRELLERDALDPDALDYVSSPLGRTRETMELLRGAIALVPTAYRVDPRLAEISFGTWEGLTLEDVRSRWPDAIAARERDKWEFAPPQAESYAAVSVRMREWYDTLDRTTVAVAHGGTLRGLLVQLGLFSAAEAPLLDIAQGVVYAIGAGGMARYG